MNGRSLLESVSPVAVTASFATAPISPALSSAVGSCSLPWRRSSWPDALLGVAVRVPGMALRVERAREDADVREPPDERIGCGLEHARKERSRGIGLDLDRRAALVDGLDRALVGRGGEVADDGVEEGLEPDPGRGRADQHGGENRFLDALAQARLELRVGDLLALEVLRQDVVVGLGGGLEELVSPARDLVGHAVGDGCLHLLAALPGEGLAVDEVDVAA